MTGASRKDFGRRLDAKRTTAAQRSCRQRRRNAAAQGRFPPPHFRKLPTATQGTTIVQYLQKCPIPNKPDHRRAATRTPARARVHPERRANGWSGGQRPPGAHPRWRATRGARIAASRYPQRPRVRLQQDAQLRKIVEGSTTRATGRARMIPTTHIDLATPPLPLTPCWPASTCTAKSRPSPYLRPPTTRTDRNAPSAHRPTRLVTPRPALRRRAAAGPSAMQRSSDRPGRAVGAASRDLGVAAPILLLSRVTLFHRAPRQVRITLVPIPV